MRDGIADGILDGASGVITLAGTMILSSSVSMFVAEDCAALETIGGRISPLLTLFIIPASRV
jgi:hypothetical protein